MLYFVIFHLISGILMFPLTLVIVSMAFAFSHVWGPVRGAVYAISLNLVLCNISFVLSFLLGRYMFRDCVKRFVVGRDGKFAALDRVIGEHGAKILCLMRCAIIFPENMLSYAFSVSNISLRQFIIGNQAILPVSCVHTYVGMTAATLTAEISDPRGFLSPH